ncbi:MAG: MarR family transcriptional regulator [Spongiibacteraceae bacterium]
MTVSSESAAAGSLSGQWPDPENHVGYLLKSLMHALRQTTETALRDAGFGLSMAHLVTLTVVHTEPGLPGAQLAKRLLITAQSMNVILKALAEAGLVEWRAHPTSQRAQSWFITVAGQEMLLGAAAACEPVFLQMQSQLDTAERTQLVGLLQRCIAGLNTP